MILSFMPFTALAIDEPEARYSTDLNGGIGEGSFAEAIENVCNGGTVTLLRDVEASGSIHISGKIITLLGEGNKIVLSPTGIVINTNAVLYLGQPGYDKALTICSSGTTYALFNLQDSAKMYKCTCIPM